jgi:NAD+ synthase
MHTRSPESADLLYVDPAALTANITEILRREVGETLKRRGLVVGISGGVDSSVCAALAVQALGPERVFGLMMPELDSEPESLALATELAEQLGIEYVVEEITPILQGCGCYRRRNDAIRRVVPEFQDDWACKVVLSGNRFGSDRLNVPYLTVQSPGGEMQTYRLPGAEYREIVAATNFKQRARKMLEYFHADRLHFAVLGTPNRLEYDQGFFVKGGDGLADVKPIAHLYKTQVYQLADYLDVPKGITSRAPTTDTYSLPQTQEEFYFSLPARALDRVLYAHNAGWSADEAAARLDLRAEEVARAYKDIEQKRSTTRYLHLAPVLMEPVFEVASHPLAGELA